MGSSSTTVQNNKPYEAARPLIDQGLSDARAMYDQGGFNITPYEGQLVAGYDPFRQYADSYAPTAVGGVLDAVRAAGAGTMGGISAVQGASGGLNYAQQGVDAARSGVGVAQDAISRHMDPNYYNAGLRGVAENVIADVMPAINSTFASAGRTGGGLHAQNLARGLSMGLANPYYDAYNAAQSRAMDAAGAYAGMAGQQANMAGMSADFADRYARYGALEADLAQRLPQIAGQSFGALDYLSDRGQDRQAYEQDVIAADVLQDQQRKTAELNALQDYLALSTGAGSQFGVQSQRTSQSPGILGMLGLGLQAAPFLWSDRRLKTDIRRVGEMDDGTPVYVYRYKDGGPFQMGVMADEVKNPEAVVDIAGYKAVDYGAI